MKRNILIIDDHFLVRNALKNILIDFGIVEVTEGTSCADLLSILKRQPITHVFLDLLVDDGNTLEVIPTVRRLYPKLLIMITSVQSFVIYKNVLKNYGITNFLQKDENELSAKKKIHDFIFNMQPIAFDENTSSLKLSTPFEKLSVRELEVLHYLLRGESTKYIATNLNIEMNTVSTIKSRIFDKTDTKNLKELMDLALVNRIN